MDSLKHLHEDETLVIESLLNDGEPTHIIGSHRAPSEFNIRQTLSVVAALTILAVLLTGAITASQTAEHAAKPSAALLASGQPFSIYHAPATITEPPLVAPVPGPSTAIAVHVVLKLKPVPVAPATPATPHVTMASSLSRIQIVIRYALAQQGKPYAWNKAGPNSFDCSGLVLAAYAQIGIHMYHFTGAMLKLGSRVSRAGMQPGDLIFPSDHHVGIYLGGNKMVVAPHAGTHVQIQTISSFYIARHIQTG